VGSEPFRVGVYSGLFQVFFKSREFFPIILQQKLTTLDLASYCGGSLGLFLGFSVLSAVEIFYYLTLRVICSHKQLNKVSIIRNGEEPRRSKNYLVEYLENSSIQGFKQMTMKKWHFIERFV
jgi:hypothetical protein